MQKFTPLLLVMVLGVTALYLSFKPRPPHPQPAAVETVATPPQPKEPAAPAPPPAPAKVAPRPWPHAASDVKADPAAHYGELPNGLRYIVYRNAEPPQRVSLRLHIAAGSLMEREDQRGLAHFLEHMVFNGTRRYAADELIPKLQQAGIAFGDEVNAGTSFDETVYQLDLPDLKESTLDLGFTVMRDFGDGALLADEEIEKERGVILSEKVTRDSVEQRLQEEEFRTLLPGSLIPERFPIGTEEVIKKAPRERFVEFYQSYYMPSRMTMIVVGDVDPAVMIKRIEREFSDMRNPAQPGKEPDLGPVAEPEGVRATVFSDPEVAGTRLGLTTLRPLVRQPDTVAKRAGEVPLEMAHAMLNRRFERQSKTANSPVLGGMSGRDEFFNHAEVGMIAVVVAGDRWQDAVPVMEQEFRRALQYGFTPAELAEARANLLTRYEQAVKQRATRKSDEFANAVADTINSETVLTTPETDLEIVRGALESLTPAACHEAFRKFWERSGMHLTLTTKQVPADAEKELSAIYQESTGVAVAAPVAVENKAFAYQDFGRPGTVATRKEVTDMGITQLVLGNHIRINLKPTDFEKNRIHLSARIGSGKLTQPADSPMLDTFAAAVFEGGGLGKHSGDELEAILAGREVDSSLAIGEDAFVLSGTTTPADFALQVRLMCASLTDPGYREEGLWQFLKTLPAFYQQMKHSPAGSQREMTAWLHGNDPRFALAPQEKLSAYTVADAKKWLGPELTKGAVELSIVGDFEVDKVLPELLATFGALPKRDKARPELAAARQVRFPNAPAAKTLRYETAIPQAEVFVFWKTIGPRGHAREMRRLDLLAEVYQDKLRKEVREQLGATYSPNGMANGSEALEDFGFILGQATGGEQDADLLLQTLRDQGAKLAETGVTADELERARLPQLKKIEQLQRDNRYWLGTVLARCQEDPQRLDSIRGRDADLRSITAAELTELARKTLKAESALTVIIKPEVKK